VGLAKRVASSVAIFLSPTKRNAQGGLWLAGWAEGGGQPRHQLFLSLHGTMC
jgi:hypothetical protein